MYASLKNQKNPNLATYGAPELPLLTKNFSGAEMRKNPQSCRSSRDEYWGGQRSSEARNRVIHLGTSRKHIRMTLGQSPPSADHDLTELSGTREENPQKTVSPDLRSMHRIY